MANQVQEIMTKQIQSVPEQATLREVARTMRDRQIGDVLVTDPSGKLCGIVTDRDLVVRALANDKDLDTTKVSEICSDKLETLEPTSSIDDAVALMRDKAIRRIPVVSNGVPVGIVTIGDLAVERDPRSALADISAAAPTG
jgi:CBS domain-containing protein